VIYRLEKCGAIESYHIIILHPQFPKKRNWRENNYENKFAFTRRVFWKN
jgi:hypothetical protein